MVGQPFSFPPADIVEQQLDPSVFQDKVTAVAFFAADELASIDVLQKLDQIFNRHNATGFGMIAINIDPNLDLVHTMLSAQVPSWSVVVAKNADASGKNPLAVKYGILKAPYVILVDSQGLVVDVGLDVRDMWIRAMELNPSLKTIAAPRRMGPSR